MSSTVLPFLVSQLLGQLRSYTSWGHFGGIWRQLCYIMGISWRHKEILRTSWGQIEEIFIQNGKRTQQTKWKAWRRMQLNLEEKKYNNSRSNIPNFLNMVQKKVMEFFPKNYFYKEVLIAYRMKYSFIFFHFKIFTLTQTHET